MTFPQCYGCGHAGGRHAKWCSVDTTIAPVTAELRPIAPIAPVKRELSDADIDRIARRVVELLGDK